MNIKNKGIFWELVMLFIWTCVMVLTCIFTLHSVLICYNSYCLSQRITLYHIGPSFFFFFLTSYFWESNHYSSFLIFVFWYLLSNFVPLRTQSSVPIFTWECDHWLDCSLHLLDLLFLHKVTSISSPLPFSSLPNSVNLFVCSGLWRTLRELISGWICLSPFDSPFSPPGHLCLLPPSSLLCVTPWTFLRGPDCGEHIRNWLLASMLCPLFIPPVLLLVTSISLLPLFLSR